MRANDKLKVSSLLLAVALAPACAESGGAAGVHGARDGSGGGDIADAAAGNGAEDASPAGGADGGGGVGVGNGAGFPGDFPVLIDAGGSGKGEVIKGFGGDTTTDRAGNRAALHHRPVVLLHGNGVNTFDPRFGMLDIRTKLLAAGYVDAEIWAPSYLGQQIQVAEVPTPQRNNIEDVRHFIDAVLDYLGVDRVDLVAHSLGCNMINDYLRGLQPDGTFAVAQRRLDRVGTAVCLGGALYGTGEGILFEPEYDESGAWLESSITLDTVEDATPFGTADVAQMNGPTTGGTLPHGRPFHRATSLDGASRRIYWVALWSIGDIVDANLKNAGGLGGADLNAGFDLPQPLAGVTSSELARHGQLVHSQAVFDAFVPYLDR